MIEPDGTKHESHTLASGFIDASKLMLATDRPVVSVMMSGGVTGKYATRDEKKARIKADADRWHESAFKGWADVPGKERDARLAVETELRRIAA